MTKASTNHIFSLDCALLLAVAQLLMILALVTGCERPSPEPTPVEQTEESLDDVLFVLTHPYNEFEGDHKLRQEVFERYRIEYIDRNDTFNDTYFRAPSSYDFDAIETANQLGIPSATYYSFDPIYLPDENWDFETKYQTQFLDEDKWRDINGEVSDDPIQDGSMKHLNGEPIISWDPGRIRMSLSNPSYLKYHMDSMTFSTEKFGIRGFNWDFLNQSIVNFPNDVGGADYSEWNIRSFRTYLKENHLDELRKMGIGNLAEFDIRQYRLEKIPGDHPQDPIFKAFYRFHWRQHARFLSTLQDHARVLGKKEGAFLPVFGNHMVAGVRHAGALYDPTAIAAAAHADIVALEIELPLYAKNLDHGPDETDPGNSELELNWQNERNFTNYKLGHAMAQHRKPVWSLMIAFKGDGERGIDPKGSFDGVLKLHLAEAYASNVVPELDVGGWPGWKDYWKGLFTRDGDTLDFAANTIAFIDEHRELFERPQSAAKTAVLVSFPSSMWNQRAFWGEAARPEENRDTTVGAGRALENLGYTYDYVMLSQPELWDDSAMIARLSRYDQIVMPVLTHLTKAQRAAISAYVINGGHLVVADGSDFSRTGRYNENGDLVGDDWIDGLLAGGGAGSVATVDATELGRSGVDSAASTEALAVSLLHPAEVSFPELTAEERNHLGVNLFDVDGKKVLHLVNYNFRYEPEHGGKFDTVEKLRVRLNDLGATAVELFNVDTQKVVELEIEDVDGAPEVVVPSLESWNFLVIDGAFST